MSRIMGAALIFIALSATASDFDATAVLERQTGLSTSEIATALKHCDSSQLNINLCAQLDQIKADHALRVVVVAARGACPHCESLSEKAVLAWFAQRDGVCRDAAKNEWGEGSMRPAAEAICATAAAEEKISAIHAMKCGTNAVGASAVASESEAPQ